MGLSVLVPKENRAKLLIELILDPALAGFFYFDFTKFLLLQNILLQSLQWARKFQKVQAKKTREIK